MFFHFSQAVWRQIQKTGLVANYSEEDPKFALNLKMLNALAFVPPSNVVQSFEKLLEFNFIHGTKIF